MANSKKKKKGKRPPSPDGFRSRWALPLPTPGDAANEPDGDVRNHICDLLVPFITRDVHRDPSMLAGVPATMEGAGAVGNKAMAAYQERITRLHADYLARLAQGHGSKTEDGLRDADVIDVSAAAVEEEARSAYAAGLRAYMSDLVSHGNLLYAYVPCFESGVLCLSRHLYVEFRIERLDLDAMRMELWLQAYELEESTGRYSRSTRGTVDAIYKELEGEPGVAYRYREDAEDSLEIFMRLPPHKLPWTRDDKILWERVVLQDAADQVARNARRGTHAVISLAKKFAAGIALSNYMMSRHRPVIAGKAPGKPQDGPLAEDEREPARTPGTVLKAPREPARRVVRNVGGVRIVSAAPPRPASPKTVRRYVTAAWTVRGFTRKTKLGKTVYVRPSVRRRRSLAGSGADPANVEIRLSGKGVPEGAEIVNAKGERDGGLESVP